MKKILISNNRKQLVKINNKNIVSVKLFWKEQFDSGFQKVIVWRLECLTGRDALNHYSHLLYSIV